MVDLLRFGLMDPDTFRWEVEVEGFRRSVRFHRLVSDEVGEWLEEDLLRGARHLYRCSLPPTSLRPRSPTHLLLAIGGMSDGISSSLLLLNPSTGVWREVGSLPAARAYGCAAVIGGSFFLCGGRTEAEPHSRQLWSIRPPALEARRLSSMRQPRNFPALAVHDGRIFAMGEELGCP